VALPSESLTIVVAAFNEEGAIEPCLRRCLAFLCEHIEEGEVIVVDDGSTDRTGGIIDELAAEEPEVRAFHLPRNMGMGAALLRGYGEARGQWVTMLPGDGQLDPYELLGFFAAAEEADLVTSLYRNRRYPLHREILSRGLRATTALIVGAKAQSEGTYLVRRSVLEKLRPRSHSFLLNQEIPIRAQLSGYRVRTVHMNVNDRTHGRSKAAAPMRVARTLADHFALRADLERERIAKALRTLLSPRRQ
jgi:glycosyltransferase involved in cell wall biosynthesis